jgi:hypothetical protein
VLSRGVGEAAETVLTIKEGPGIIISSISTFLMKIFISLSLRRQILARKNTMNINDSSLSQS